MPDEYTSAHPNHVDRALADEARPDGPPAPDLISIIVPCPGQLEYTRLCLPAALRFSRQPCEFLLVDVESLDGTAAYLDGLRAASAAPIRVLHARDDRGIPAACDLAVARARGRYVAILANDAIVTPGWLDHLAALLAFSPDLGAVGPMLNHSFAPQVVDAIPYGPELALALHPPRDGRSDPEADAPISVEAPILRFAERWRQEHRGQWTEVEALDPACVLFRREALAALPSLEKLGGPGGSSPLLHAFDPPTLASRLLRAGFRLACCRDLFLHHFASRSSSGPVSTPR